MSRKLAPARWVEGKRGQGAARGRTRDAPPAALKRAVRARDAVRISRAFAPPPAAASTTASAERVASAGSTSAASASSPAPPALQVRQVMLPGAMASRAPFGGSPRRVACSAQPTVGRGGGSSADLKTREAHARRRCATWRCKARIKSCAPPSTLTRARGRARSSVNSAQTPRGHFEMHAAAAARVSRPWSSPPRDARFSQGLHAVVARRPSVVARCSPPDDAGVARRSAPGQTRETLRDMGDGRRVQARAGAASSPRVRRRSPARSARVAAAPSTASTSPPSTSSSCPRRASPGPRTPTILQVNIGLCNQACSHCHVESSPLRGGGDE